MPVIATRIGPRGPRTVHVVRAAPGPGVLTVDSWAAGISNAFATRGRAAAHRAAGVVEAVVVVGEDVVLDDEALDTPVAVGPPGGEPGDGLTDDSALDGCGTSAPGGVLGTPGAGGAAGAGRRSEPGERVASNLGRVAPEVMITGAATEAEPGAGAAAAATGGPTVGAGDVGSAASETPASSRDDEPPVPGESGTGHAPDA